MICQAVDCSKKIHAKSLCSTHYARLLAHGDPSVNLKPMSPAGSGKTTSHGYRMVRLSPQDPFFSMAGRDKYVYEHRLTMARSLGRPLERTETVHHINGDTLDNRIENLQLRGRSHGPGVARVCNSCGSSDIKEVPLH